jgi:filamentous hemagglutinin family protein
MRLICCGLGLPVAGLAAAMMILWAGGEARAQGITVDGRLSPGRTLTGPDYAIRAELGQQVGGNLFHSFGAFSLNSGERATFSGPAGPATVNNVIGRVTGGAQSAINGTIRSTIQGANVYLINPAGVVLGPNARVDVSGAFHASSADYLRQRDGTRFQATNPDASTLSAAPPEAFGFLNPNPRPVTVNGADLGVLAGRTLGLVGGAVTISGGVLQAPAGTVHVISAAGQGEVPVEPRSGPAPTVAGFGPVRVERRGRIVVSDADGRGNSGSVFVRGGTLDISASTIDANNNGSGKAGEVYLRGDGAVTIRSGTEVNALTRTSEGADVTISTAPGGAVTVNAASIVLGSQGSGNNGALSINTGTLTLQNGAVVESYADRSGNVGLTDIRAESMLLDGATTRLSTETTGLDLVDRAGNLVPAGAGGRISLVGGKLEVQNGASIAAFARGDGPGGSISVVMAGDVVVMRGASIGASTDRRLGQGRGGDVRVTAAGVLLIDSGDGNLGRSRLFTRSTSLGDAGSLDVRAQTVAVLGSEISASTFNVGNAGNVTVKTEPGTLSLNSGLIGSVSNGSGNAGQVVVSAGNLTIRDGGISASTGGDGKAGDVTVQAASISLQDSAFINSSTFGRGSGGTVDVTATGSLQIVGAPGQTSPTGIRAQSNSTSTGDAGQVVVRAGSLAISQGGVISTATLGQGAAGNVNVDVSGGPITIDGRGVVAAARSGLPLVTGITSAADVESIGAPGNIMVRAGSLTIFRNGQINASTFGSRSAGDVTVDVSGPIIIDGSGRGTRLTGIGSQAEFGSIGDAGQVVVNAGNLTIINEGDISSVAGGTGRGGDVHVTASSDILLTGSGSRITAASFSTERAGLIAISAPRLRLRDGASVSTEAQGGNGGDITMSLGDLLHLRQSSITTSVNGALGNGGNITISNPRFVVLDRSVIRANAVGGRGGNVTIRADQFVQSAGSDVTATSELSVPGEITISSPPPNLTGSLVVLASELRAAAALLQGSCATQGAKLRSSLVVAGRGGQRQSVETTVPALYILNRPVRGSQEQAVENPSSPLHTTVSLASRCE